MLNHRHFDFSVSYLTYLCELCFSEFFALHGTGEGIQAIESNLYNKDVFLNSGSCLLHPSFSLLWPRSLGGRELLSVSPCAEEGKEPQAEDAQGRLPCVPT